jgi:hypothetical protein
MHFNVKTGLIVLGIILLTLRFRTQLIASLGGLPLAKQVIG